MFISRYLHLLRPLCDAEVVTGGTMHQSNPPLGDSSSGDGKAEESAKRIKELETKLEETLNGHKELQSRYADVDEKLRNFGKMKRQFETWQQRVKEEPETVIQEMGGDPVLAAARALPDLDPRSKEDEPPSWFKDFAKNTNDRLEQALSFQKEQKQQQTHYGRVGQIQGYMGQDGVGDQFPMLKMLGSAGVDQAARVMGQREEQDGVPPNVVEILKEQENMLDKYNQQTTKIWAKNKLTAQRMVDALQEEGYSIHAVGPRLTLLNEDSTDSGPDVDTSKLSGDALIRYNMELADRMAAAEKKKAP
jgi:chromosome segregation ATPase